MCQNSLVENEQIEKCIENGMPKKIVKSIQHTIRKRAANVEINNKLQQEQQPMTSNQSTNSNSKNKAQETVKPVDPQTIPISKCPFGHGKFTTPAAKFFVSPLTPLSPTNPTASLAANEFDFSNNNNNNNLYELLPQFPQFNTTTTGSKSTTEDNGNAIPNLSGHFDDDNKKLLLAKAEMYNDDILAKSTWLTREFTHKMQQAMRRLHSSKLYTLLTKTTQPAHFVAIAIVTFVLVTVWPDLLLDGKNESGGQYSGNQQQHITSVPSQDISAKKSMLALTAYLGAFSIHFGAQIWMTFVSGLSLYFSLPRHIFGQCQQILFPKYFAINAGLSIAMVILYAKYLINTWTLAKCIQLGSLSLSAAIELLVRLYMAPPLLRLMHEKYKIEGTVGSGKETGTLVQGDLIKCPHYQRIHKAFRRIHMTVAIGNVITMAGSCLQLYCIAGQLQISLVH